jgi:hypothetical protein
MLGISGVFAAGAPAVSAAAPKAAPPCACFPIRREFAVDLHQGVSDEKIALKSYWSFRELESKPGSSEQAKLWIGCPNPDHAASRRSG